MGLREQKKAMRYREIIDTAKRLFVRYGYDSVSMHEIGQCIGISETTIFNYFASKHLLLEAIIDEAQIEISRKSQDIINSYEKYSLDKVMNVIGVMTDIYGLYPKDIYNVDLGISIINHKIPIFYPVINHILNQTLDSISRDAGIEYGDNIRRAVANIVFSELVLHLANDDTNPTRMMKRIRSQMEEIVGDEYIGNDAGTQDKIA